MSVVQPGEYEAATRQRAIEARRRLYGGASKPKRLPIERHIVMPVVEPIAEPTPEAVDLPYAPPTVRGIINSVCAKHMIGRADLMSMSRRPHLVLARQECCYELRVTILIKGKPISWAQIARHLGLHDHTTALYGYRQHAKLIAELSTVSTVVTGTGTDAG